MTEKRHLNQKMDTWEIIKIILCMVFMTTFFALYHYHPNYNEALISSSSYNDIKIITKIDQNVNEGFVVWNDNCRIPNISAFDKSIKNLIKKSNPPKCSTKSLLTSVILNVDTWSYTFKINHDFKSKTVKSTINCCYSSINREKLKFKKNSRDDDRYKVESECHSIKDSQMIPKHVEFMLVTCELRPNGNKSRSTVYKDVHSMVIDKGQRRFRNADVPSKPSVLIISIDSLSRLNLIRSMPLTYRLLETHGFMSLEGYTKVADNTFPNLVPILTGMTVGQMTKQCWKNPKDEMDECPFLWKNFKEQGYVTAYVEDEPGMGTFNFGKYGFRNAPTDYYSRPYMLAAEQLLSVAKHGGMNYCLGPRSAVDRVYGYADEFVRLHRGHGYFAVFWMNTFSHNDVNAPSAADRRTADALSRWLDAGLLDNAVTIVLSDHGLRFGEIRGTHVGWLEDRMPAFYARLPPGYAAAHPGHRAALAANRNRLTSPFDLHLTLKQLLFTDDRRAVSDGCSACSSLFHLADANRSCEQAGIAPHWCACEEYEPLDPHSRVAADGGQHVVLELNRLLTKYRASVRKGYTCAKLSLRKMVSARSRPNRRRRTGGDSGREYLFVVETMPGRSMFEVTVDRLERDGSATFGPMGDVSRINMYGFQSQCTNDWRLKKHCYCVKTKRPRP